MGIISKVSKIADGRIGRFILYTGFVYLLGYSSGKGYFSGQPKYQQIDSNRPVQCSNNREIYKINPEQGKLEKITILETKKEDEEILKMRNR